MEYYLVSLYKFSGASCACSAFTVLHLNLSALRHCQIEDKYHIRRHTIATCKPSSFITNGSRLPRLPCVKCTAKHTTARCEAVFNISKFHHGGSDATRAVKAHIADNICGWRAYFHGWSYSKDCRQQFSILVTKFFPQTIRSIQFLYWKNIII